MDSQQTPKQQVAERIKNASSIMVTAGKNPNVDEVASAIGLTHMLQAMNKHASAVISADLPAVVDFLNPHETIETTTDRLRDFVITFSKEKADKLRYKVIDEDVKIFITPYKTVLTQDDLAFTQGDYNIDTVIVLGATKREALDKVVLENSRVMSDSKVVTINAGSEKNPEIGDINWIDNDASSIAEMLVSISEALASGLLNKQSSEALLTGLVSATNQFGNTNTTPKVMTMAAQLMAAGANQQEIMGAFDKQKELTVAHKEQKEAPKQSPKVDNVDESVEESKPEEPVIEFTHNEPQAAPTAEPVVQQQPQKLPKPQSEESSASSNEIHVEPALAESYDGQEPEVPGVFNGDPHSLEADQTPSTTKPAADLPQPQQVPQNDSPSLVITEPPRDRIVLDGATDISQARMPQRPEPPHIQTDHRERLAEPPKDEIDNPLLSPPPTEDRSQPALNAHDHSTEQKSPEAEEKHDAPMLDHSKSSKKSQSNQEVRDVNVDMNDGPHIKVNPDAPVLNTKKAAAPKQQQPKPKQEDSAADTDALAAARAAVEQAADAQAPSLPKPLEALSAQEMAEGSESDGSSITIDHNGNIQQG